MDPDVSPERLVWSLTGWGLCSYPVSLTEIAAQQRMWHRASLACQHAQGLTDEAQGLRGSERCTLSSL